MKLKRTFSFQVAHGSNGTYSRFSCELNFLKIALFVLFAFTILFIGYYFGRLSSRQKAELVASSHHNVIFATTSSVTSISATPPEDIPSLNVSLQSKREFIQNLILEHWSHLVAAEPAEGPAKIQHTFTVVRTMSTLWIAELHEKFKEGRQWIEAKVEVEKLATGNQWQAVTQFLASMLSCFALTGDGFFLERAREMGAAVKKDLNPKGEVQTLDQLGGAHLELRYLSDLSHDADLQKAVADTRTLLGSITKPHGLYPTTLVDDHFTSDLVTLDRPSTHFYMTLVWAYLQSAYRDQVALELYKEAITTLDKAGMINHSLGSLWITRKFNITLGTLTEDHQMTPEVCNLGALFTTALRAITRKLSIDSEKELFRSGDVQLNFRHWSWAAGFTEMCRRVAEEAEAGLLPERFSFDPNGTLIVTEKSSKVYR